jgi:hypothetical protein
MDKTMISVDRMRIRLAIIWFSGAGLILAVMIAGSLNGLFGDNTQAVWEWLMPTVMPTLGTIVSTLAATALLQTSSESEVRRSFSLIAEGLSLFYLLLIFAVIVFKQSISIDTLKWLDKLRMSNLWLGPLQGLVATVLGVVFLSKKQKPDAVAEEHGGH